MCERERDRDREREEPMMMPTSQLTNPCKAAQAAVLVQWEKAVATMSDGLSLIPREGKD